MRQGILPRGDVRSEGKGVPVSSESQALTKGLGGHLIQGEGTACNAAITGGVPAVEEVNGRGLRREESKGRMEL